MAHPLTERIERFVREHELLSPGDEIACLVSGGPDSTCLWHALEALGYRVRAIHVHHGLRGSESDEDARHCVTLMGADVVSVPPGSTEDALRELRYGATEPYGLRATGHTASDQVETVLYRLVSSGGDAGHQGASRGRRGAAAALRVARGDRGVLPRRGPSRAPRLVERRHRAWPDPGRDPAPAAAPAPRSRREPPRPR